MTSPAVAVATMTQDAVTQMALRVLQEALAEALPWYWLRRAEQLEAARPRATDFNGAATEQDLRARDERLAGAAAACRERAAFLRAYPDVLAEQIAGDVEALMTGAVSHE